MKKAKEGKLIGQISHYFSKIGVGIVKLSGALAQGDKIRIIGRGDVDFNQKVDSIQINHKEVKKAQKGQVVGLKVIERVREGYRVYKI